MKIIKSYTDGFNRTAGSLKLVTIIYGITLLLGLLVMLPFNSSVSNSVGARPEMYRLLSDFDFTVYSDFMNNYGDIVRPYLNQFVWFGAFYFFFTVFFAGGILKSFEGSVIKSRAQAFFAGSTKYFFRFLRLGFYTLIFQVLIFAAVAITFSSIFSSKMDTSAEPALFNILVVWLSLHVLFFILISIVSDYAKIILVKEDSKKVWRALWSSFKFTFRKLLLTLPLYLILLLIPVVLVFVYLVLESAIGMSGGFTVFIILLIQQFFIWSRLFIKVWILGSEYELFNNCLIETTQPLLTQEMLMNEVL